MAAKLHNCSKNDCVHKCNRSSDAEFRLLYLLSCAHSVCETCLVKVVTNNETFVKCDACAFITNIERDIIKNINLQVNGHAHETSFGAANTGIPKFSVNNSEVLPVDSYVFGQAFNAGSIEARKTVETIDIDLDGDFEPQQKKHLSTVEMEDNDPFILGAPDRIRNKAKPEYLEVVEFAIKSYVQQKDSWRGIITEKIKIDQQATKLEDDITKNFHLLHSLLQIREMEAKKELKEAFAMKERELSNFEEQLSSQRRQLKSLILKSAQVNLESDRKKVEVDLMKAASKPSLFSNESNFEIGISYDQDIKRSLRHYAQVSRDATAISNSYKLSPIDSPICVKPKINGGTIIEPVYDDDDDIDVEIKESVESDQAEQLEIIEEPVKIQRLKEEVVTVTRVTTPENFCVVLESASEVGIALQKEIDTWCLNTYRHPPALNTLNNGDYCFAFSDMFQKWCRARFERANEKASSSIAQRFRNIAIGGFVAKGAIVSLIDFGTEADIEYTNIREKREELFDMTVYPQQFIKCSLYNIRPNPNDTWSKQSIDCFKRFVSDRKMIMYVKDVVDSVHMVDLSHFDLLDVSSGKSSLIELMVFTKNAKFKFGDTNNEH
ncbi:RING finger protein 17-like protein, partial [Leptotrombidium deliense]